MSTTPADIYSQLVRDEGKKASAYDDADGASISVGTTVKGFVTIAVGVCIDARNGSGLTESEIELLTKNRIAAAESELSQAFPWTDALDEVRRMVLVNMVYQMYIVGLGKFRVMLAALQQGDFTSAAAAMLDSEWARVQSPARAKRLSLQLNTGQWQ